MGSIVQIYLSGSIRKGRQDERGDEFFWTEGNELEIKESLPFDFRLLNPAKTPIRRNDFFVNYGCDLYLVELADVVLADLRTEKGIGVGAELMFAQFVRKPVVGWLPPNSYYRRDLVQDVFGEDLHSWTHPFAYGLCDIVADDLKTACNHIIAMHSKGAFTKNPEKTPERAIKAFKNVYQHMLRHE